MIYRKFLVGVLKGYVGFCYNFFWLLFDFMEIGSITALTFFKKRLHNLSVIRQKDESQNRCLKKTKRVKFSEKRKFLTPWYSQRQPHKMVKHTQTIRRPIVRVDLALKEFRATSLQEEMFMTKSDFKEPSWMMRKIMGNTIFRTFEYLRIFGTKEVVFNKINIKYVRNRLQISRLTLSEFKEVRCNKNLPMNFL